MIARIFVMSLFVFGIIYLSPVQSLAGKAEGEKIFQTRCTICHTIGGGKLVGPDLGEVFKRRQVAWVKKFIKDPDKMINKDKDPIAVKLFNDNNMVPMVVSPALTDKERDDVVDYLQDATKGKAPKS